MINELIDDWENKYVESEKAAAKLGKEIIKRLKPVCPDIEYSIGGYEAGAELLNIHLNNKIEIPSYFNEEGWKKFSKDHKNLDHYFGKKMQNTKYVYINLLPGYLKNSDYEEAVKLLEE